MLGDVYKSQVVLIDNLHILSPFLIIPPLTIEQLRPDLLYNGRTSGFLRRSARYLHGKLSLPPSKITLPTLNFLPTR